jgi:hypothetical protein
MELKQITNFNDLENFKEDTDYYTLFKTILNNSIESGSSGDDVYNTINDLRKLNKFERSAFSRIFDTVCYKVKKLLLSENMDIAYITLVLLSEVLVDTWRYNDVNDWLELVLPNLLLIAVENKLLAGFALTCLNSCATNGFYDDVFVTLLNEILEEGDTKAQYSYNLLTSLINNCDTMLLIEGLNWDPIFEKMAEIYLSPRSGLVILTCEIIKAKFNRDELFKVLGNVEDDYVASLLNEMFKLHHKDRVDLNRFKNN